MKIALKTQISEKLSNRKYTKYNASLAGMVKQNTVDGRMQKKVLLQPVWIRYDFQFREPELYNLVTTVTRDDDIQNIYTVPVVRCNQQTSVEESKYEEKRKSALIVTG